MTKDDALRLALEAMKVNNNAWESLADSGDAGFWKAEEQGYYQLNEKAITAVEAALEAKDEPFEYWNAVEGWVKIEEVRDHFNSVGCGTIYKTSGEDRVPLYTTPPQRTWVGLTKEEFIYFSSCCHFEVVDEIEKLLQRKNT
jgi:hypothetical protein